jgi:hypothetical protein
MDSDSLHQAISNAVAELDCGPADLQHGYTDRERRDREDTADQLRDLVHDLDMRLRRGGELPKAWRR